MPATSMTGFGSTEGEFPSEAGTIRWRWDIRSVNGKGLDVKLRLPHGLERLEPPLRETAKVLGRGSVQATLSFSAEGKPSRLGLNGDTLRDLSSVIAQLRLAIECDLPRADGLLSLPGVLVREEAVTPDPDVLDPALRAGFSEALVRLREMRAEEGARLKTVVLGHVTAVRKLVGDARHDATAGADARLGHLREKLRNFVKDAADLTEDRVAQEAALLAVKADVTEELNRLDAHADAVEQALSSDEPAGRRLDFLAQELAREAATLTVKAASQSLNETGLSLKLVIDQIREQVQNIL